MILITAIGMLTLFILAKLIYLVWPPQSGRAVAIDWNFASKFTYWQVAIRDSFDFFGVGFSLLQFFKVDCRMYLMAGALAFFVIWNNCLDYTTSCGFITLVSGYYSW